MKNKTLTFLFTAVFSGLFSLALISPAGAAPGSSAVDCSGNNVILTIPAWYKNLAEPDSSGEDCDIKSPDEVGGLSTFLTIIALNIIDMMLNVVVYVVAGFIIYGGFQYMLAQGSAQHIVGAKKTIMNAVIGLIISILAIVVVRFITGVFST